jgi:arginine-tRNA-protein transferase
MKIFSSELGHNYDTYTFGYSNYCIREPDDKLSDIYELGYLPYSGSPDVKNVFYMARSARVPLGSFVLSSENRRVARKFDNRLTAQVIPLKEYDRNDNAFVSFCIEYFVQRHGPGIMPVERLKSILNSELIADIVVYQNAPELTAYVFEVSDSDMTHFWYSFYDLKLAHQSLGMWLMLDSARRAKKRGAKFFYIGTVYGQKALYKTAFKNIEFWDGKHWVADYKKIKHLGRDDGGRVIGLTDLWKKELKRF